MSGQPIRWRSSGGAGVQPAAWPLMASRDPSWLEAQAQSGGRGRAGRRPCCPLPQTKGSSGASQALGQGPHPSRLRAAGHRAPCPPLQLLWQDWWPAGDHVAVGREPPSISARAFLVSHTVWTRLSEQLAKEPLIFSVWVSLREVQRHQLLGPSPHLPSTSPPPRPPGGRRCGSEEVTQPPSSADSVTKRGAGGTSRSTRSPRAALAASTENGVLQAPTLRPQTAPPVGWVGAGWRQPGCLGWRGGAHSAAGEEALRSHVPRRVWPRKGRVYAPARSAV